MMVTISGGRLVRGEEESKEDDGDAALLLSESRGDIVI